jgi:hypothetical protein
MGLIILRSVIMKPPWLSQIFQVLNDLWFLTVHSLTPTARRQVQVENAQTVKNLHSGRLHCSSGVPDALTAPLLPGANRGIQPASERFEVFQYSALSVGQIYSHTLAHNPQIAGNRRISNRANSCLCLGFAQG